MNQEARWYVAHTYSGYERKAASAIKQSAEARKMSDVILNVVVPEEERTEITDKGKKRTSKRLIYPGYVFVQMILTDQAWHVVRNSTGVTGFVSEANKPVPLTDNEIDTLGMERKATVITTFEVGDIVNIVDGPLEGFDGKITSIDANASSAKVAVAMFGRESEIDIDFEQLERAK